MSRSEPAGITPGEYLRGEIERLGLDQVAVAEATDVSRQTINNIVNGRQDISRAMAAKLARLTSRSPDFWLRSQFPPAETQPPGSASADDRGEPINRRDGGLPSILVNHEIARAVRDGIIVIQPFKQEHVQLASIDLTLDDFIIIGSGRVVDISGDQGFTLRGGETVNVSTKELLEFPRDHVGRIGAMTRLAKFGIITSHGFQVDPGFSGNLQFCLFNASRQPFELRSGEPIVSLEIARLAAVPSPNASVSAQIHASSNREDVRSHFGSDDSDRAIRDYLRAQVQTAPSGAEVVARIPALDIEVFDHPKQTAIDGAVDFALGTLSDIQANAETETDLSDRYRTFFDRAASSLHLSAGQIRSALESLAMVDADTMRPRVKLRDGTDVILQVPRGTAKISLRNLAGQLRLESVDLILMLTGRYAVGP